MNDKLFSISVLILLFFVAPKRTRAADVELFNLRCEKLMEPLGIDIERPGFSWEMRLKHGHKENGQVAYQLLVATSADKLDPQNADLWNSGKMLNDSSTWVGYNGAKLKSNMRYFWKVLVWYKKGKDANPASGTSFFQTGFMNPGEWKAKWIGLERSFAWDSPTDTHSRLSARYFRKQFKIKGKIKRATVFFTGLGLYKLYIDDQALGTQELSPIASDFRKKVYYNVFDVTKKIQNGENEIGAVLGNGKFFSMRPGKPGEWKEGIPTLLNFGYPKLLFQLEIEYENGKKETIISDKSWKVTADGPIRSNNEFDGEVYDRNKEMAGWNTTSFDDSRWLPVDLSRAPEGVLHWQQSPNMKIMHIIKPLSIKKIGPDKFLVDMGQNMVGWVHIRLKSSANTPVVLRYGERLNIDGTLYTKNLRSARVTDSIYHVGEQSLDWQPSFVFHGFKYVEVAGVASLEPSDIKGEIVYDNMQTTGNFTSSDSTLNQIYKAAWWTISGNYKGMPVDCPQRDERMGWLGDRSMNCYGESFLFDNYHLYAKWLDDIADAQNANGSLPDIAPGFWPGFRTDNMTWPSSYLFVAEMLYRQFGDKGIIVRHYARMKKWMAHMLTYISADSLVERDNFGDWCMPPESLELINSKDSTRITPGGFIGASYYIHCLKMMSEFAGITGRVADSTTFMALRSTMVKAINKKYFNQELGHYANNTVTANLLALAFDIVPKSRRKDVADNIAKVSAHKYDDHVSTGLIGDQWLMRGLTDNGYSDIAFKIATNTTYPSWGYMLNQGSTTIWELWNGNTANPAMNSGNHVMLLGDLLVWYYENLAGIKAASPGFKTVEMRPLVNIPLKFVNATYQSPYGEIKSHWRKENKVFYWDIVLPPNCTATICVPSKSKDVIQFQGEHHFISDKDGYFKYNVHNGSFHIRSELE